MAELVVRNLEEKVVQELERLAARNGRSAEEEHRQILRRALGLESSGLHPKPSLKQLLSEMPGGADDGDFERSQDFGRPVEL